MNRLLRLGFGPVLAFDLLEANLGGLLARGVVSMNGLSQSQSAEFLVQCLRCEGVAKNGLKLLGVQQQEPLSWCTTLVALQEFTERKYALCHNGFHLF